MLTPFPRVIHLMVAISEEIEPSMRLRLVANDVLATAHSEQVARAAQLLGASGGVPHSDDSNVQALISAPSSLPPGVPRPVIGIVVSDMGDEDAMPQFAEPARGFTAAHWPTAGLLPIPHAAMFTLQEAFPPGTSDTWIRQYWDFLGRQAKTPAIANLRWYLTAIVALQSLAEAGGAEKGFTTEQEQLTLMIAASNRVAEAPR